jgi:glycosyltransferase involved in cell wall biosynthesis
VLTGALGLQRIRQLLDKGWLIVTEFDDLPDHFPALRGSDNHSFSGVHACQVTTPALASIVRERNPEVAVFPNAIRALPKPRNFTDPAHLTMFFGALNREADWEPFIGVLNEIASEHANRLSFLVVHDRAFFDALSTPSKTFVPTCDYARYIELLSGCELAFMPLLPSEFNRAKSDLKFIETAACGAAALASETVYGEAIEDGRTGLIFRDPLELRLRLERLVRVPSDARAIGQAARQHVAQCRMLAYQTLDRRRWYSWLWSRREELTAALIERVPELRSTAPGPTAAS